MQAVIFTINIMIFCLAFLPYAFIFKKSGEAKWLAFVPFYNIYIICKIAKDHKYALWFLGIAILCCAIPAPIAFYDKELYKSTASFLIYIVNCLVLVELTNRFDKGIIVKILVCIPFTQWLTMLYLGLNGDCEYEKFTKK